jgi:hypothetical protein
MDARLQTRALLLFLASATVVNDEVWLPRRVRASGSARLGLLKVMRIEQEISYSKCREFQTDSPIVSQMEAR